MGNLVQGYVEKYVILHSLVKPVFLALGKFKNHRNYFQRNICLTLFSFEANFIWFGYITKLFKFLSVEWAIYHNSSKSTNWNKMLITAEKDFNLKLISKLFIV